MALCLEQRSVAFREEEKQVPKASGVVVVINLSGYSADEANLLAVLGGLVIITSDEATSFCNMSEKVHWDRGWAKFVHPIQFSCLVLLVVSCCLWHLNGWPTVPLPGLWSLLQTAAPQRHGFSAQVTRWRSRWQDCQLKVPVVDEMRHSGLRWLEGEGKMAVDSSVMWQHSDGIQLVMKRFHEDFSIPPPCPYTKYTFKGETTDIYSNLSLSLSLLPACPKKHNPDAGVSSATKSTSVPSLSCFCELHKTVAGLLIQPRAEAPCYSPEKGIASAWSLMRWAWPTLRSGWCSCRWHGRFLLLSPTHPASTLSGLPSGTSFTDSAEQCAVDCFACRRSKVQALPGALDLSGQHFCISRMV